MILFGYISSAHDGLNNHPPIKDSDINNKFDDDLEFIDTIKNILDENDDNCKRVVYCYSCNHIINTNGSLVPMVSDDSIFILPHIEGIVNEIREIHKDTIVFMLIECDSYQQAYDMALDTLANQNDPLCYTID